MNLKKQIAKYIKAFLACAIVGYILIVLMYLLPAPVIKGHLQDGLDHMAEMGTYPQIVEGYKSTQLDYYTDYIKLAITAYDGDENALVKAATNPRIGNGYGETELVEYGWYWHGYTVFLKPIFMVMSYWDFKIINIILTVGTVILTVYLLMKHEQRDFVVPYFLALIVINPVVVSLSFQFLPCYYVMHLVLWYLIINSGNKDVDIPFVFFAGGILITYFDLLTYPLVVYGVPIAFVAQVMIARGEKFNDVFKKMIISGVTFILGYGLMFAAKFAIGGVVTGGEVVGNATEHILTRVSGSGMDTDIRRVDAIVRNLQVLGHVPFYILLVGVVILVLVNCYRRYKKYGNAGLAMLEPCVIIFIMPFVWYFVLANHSHIHYFFTYRNLAVSAAALGMLTRRS